MPANADELVELLDLETLDVDLFRGRQPETDRQRVFGGQVAAQALLAGVRTAADDLQVHSMHSYFLRPGDTAVPIIYDVERLRDGRSFSTRRVVARQHGHAIFFMTASLQRAEEGLDHQDAMPEVLGPEAGLDFAEIARQRGQASESFAREWSALEVRYLGNSAYNLTDDPSRPARAQLWIRVNGRLSDDPREHLATFTYASDMTPARRRAGAARHHHRRPQAPAGVAGPRDLVPPAVPGRRVVALRPGVALGQRRPRSGAGPGLHPGRLPGRHGGAGGAHPRPRLIRGNALH